MFYFSKIMASILVFLISVTCISSHTVWAEDPQPPIAGEYGIAIDAATGDVLYDKNANGQAYPASMTKVLTAIVLDEKKTDHEMLTVSPYAARQECSCFGLTAGEQISKQDAMYGLLLLSANDMAVTIAENVGGSVEGFAQLMNDEVQELGLQHTHFVTPNGLHDPNHYTTPYDMALIMKEALKHPKVLNALSTESIQVHTSVQDKKLRNKSEVHTQPESAHVVAGKTGFTDQAGNTLVEYLKDGDKEVIAVVMKTHKKEEYTDIQAMANYAFAHMKTKKIASKNEVVVKTELNGEKVKLIAPDDIKVGLKNGDNSKLKTKVELVSTAGEAIQKGQVVANLKVLKGKEIVKEAPLVTDQTITATKKIKSMKTTGDRNADSKKSIGITEIGWVPVGIILLFFILYIARNRNVQNRKRMVSK